MKIKRLLSVLSCALLLVCAFPTAYAADTLEPGSTYALSGKLSCYVNAMGGIEFADGMLNGITVQTDQNGNATMTLSLGISTGTIYTVDYIAFADAEKCAPGYYDESGVLHRNASYTLSRNSATDSGGNRVRYVNSITFPISVSKLCSTYYLYIYIESNVMGVQFCNGKGSGESNSPGVTTPYAAKLTVDWGSLHAGPSDTQSRDATVTYTAGRTDEGLYLLRIPEEIIADVGADGSGSFVFEADLIESDLSEHTAIQMILPEHIDLICGDTLRSADARLGKRLLCEEGDSVFGAVMLNAAPAGHYAGRADFTVSLVETAQEQTESET